MFEIAISQQRSYKMSIGKHTLFFEGSVRSDKKFFMCFYIIKQLKLVNASTEVLGRSFNKLAR